MNHTPRAPGSVVAAAVIYFVYAAQILFCMSCTGLIFAADMDDGGVNELLAKEVPGFMAIQIGTLLFNLLMGSATIVTALGLLRLMPMARTATFGIAFLDFAVTFGGSIYSAFLVLPAHDRIFAQQAQNLPPEIAAATSVGNWAYLFFNIALALGVEVGVILLLCSATAKAAFAGETSAPPDEALRTRFDRLDDEADDYGRSWRDDDDAPPDTGFRTRF